MIIVCNNCDKKFDIDSNLIPDKGRLLECNGCNHKWFFKREVAKEPTEIIDNEAEHTIELLDKTVKRTTNIVKNPQNKQIDTIEEKKLKKSSKPKTKNVRSFKILNLSIIFIISFVAFIILVDTFKFQIGNIVPNIEFLLYNLYESFKDIFFFIKDLI